MSLFFGMMIHLLHGNYGSSMPPSFFLSLIESIFLKSQTVSTAEVLCLTPEMLQSQVSLLLFYFATTIRAGRRSADFELLWCFCFALVSCKGKAVFSSKLTLDQGGKMVEVEHMIQGIYVQGLVKGSP